MLLERRRDAACVLKRRTKPDARGRAEDEEGNNTGEAKRRHKGWRTAVVQQESVGLVATKRKVRDGHCPRCNYINYYSKYYYYFANMQCNYPDPNTSGEVYMTASQGT